MLPAVWISGAPCQSRPERALPVCEQLRGLFEIVVTDGGGLIRDTHVPRKDGPRVAAAGPIAPAVCPEIPNGGILSIYPCGVFVKRRTKKEPLHRSGSRSFPRFFPLRVAALAGGDRPAASVKEAAADAICSSFLPHRVLPAAAIPSPRSGRSSPEIPHRAARSDRPAPSPPAAHRADTGIARCSPL